MTSSSRGEALVSELLANPLKFTEQGNAYQLLQAYFDGYSLETLSPLLTNQNVMVQRAAVWVASELGKQACSLIHDVIPLIDSHDRNIKYHALECAIVCASGANVKEFVHVVRSLQSEDDVIRRLAMRLMSNADRAQLEGLLSSDAISTLGSVHARGLLQLSRPVPVEPKDVLQLIESPDPLDRKYGAIAAKRFLKSFPQLIVAAAASSDLEVQRFAREELESRKH